MVFSLPQLYCESSVSVKESPNRKKKSSESLRNFNEIFRKNVTLILNDVILNFAKNQGFIFSLEDRYFKKLHGERGTIEKFEGIWYAKVIFKGRLPQIYSVRS